VKEKSDFIEKAFFRGKIVSFAYGVATISRLLKIISLFCRIQSLLQGSFPVETYNFTEPTNRSHPITLFASHEHTKTYTRIIGNTSV